MPIDVNITQRVNLSHIMYTCLNALQSIHFLYPVAAFGVRGFAVADASCHRELVVTLTVAGALKSTD